MYQRDDDKPETIQNRLDVYATQTAPLIDYYNGHDLLVEVDGDRPVDVVYEEVKEKLGL
jgi:adenylate kinase